MSRSPLTDDDRALVSRHLSQALAIVEGKSLAGQSLGWIEDRISEVSTLIETGVARRIRSRSRSASPQQYEARA